MISAANHQNISDQGARSLYKDMENKWAFYGLLIYTMMFYSQFAGRFPVLAPLRLEFWLGAILVFYSIYKMFAGQVNFNENKLNYAATLFIVTAFISVIFAYVKMRAFNAFTDMIKFFAIYLMIITTIDSEKKLRIFVNVYVAMITLIFFEPFLLSLQGKGFVWNNGMWRLAGVTNYFGHPNQLGGITAANLPFLYYMMKYHKSKKWKFVYLVLIIASLRVIMLTQSRTAFVGVIAFAFILWLFSKKKIRSIILIFLITVIVWQFTPQEAKDRFLSLGMARGVVSGQTGHDEAGSMYSRWVLIQRGFIAFKENPIIGLGPTCYISFNGHRFGYFFPPHNTYIQALSEMGIVGFIAFISVIIIILQNLNKAKRILSDITDDNEYLVTLTTLVSVYLLVRLVVSMFGQELYDNYWWVAGGLSVVIMRTAFLKYEKENDQEGQDTPQEKLSHEE